MKKESKKNFKLSNPSSLKITDMRIAVIGEKGWRWPIIKLYTNQDIVGYGEVRDGASAKYALMLKSKILGENPCDIDRIFPEGLDEIKEYFFVFFMFFAIFFKSLCWV